VAKLIQDRISQLRTDRELHRKEQERLRAEAEKHKEVEALQHELARFREMKVR